MEHDLIATIRLPEQKETGRRREMFMWDDATVAYSSYCSRQSEETNVKHREGYQVRARNLNERENSVMFLLS
jgi:hypothetical protein